MNKAPILVWFRLDLRLADNPALNAASQSGTPIIPLYVHAPEEEAPWEPGAASRWWLHHSLAALDDSLRRNGSRLILRRGPSLETLTSIIQETGARAVFWNRRYEPAVLARDARIKEAFRTAGVQADSFNSALLHEPWTVRNQSKKPFRVFTPFWKHCLAKGDPADPHPAPAHLSAPARWPRSAALDQLQLEPKGHWTHGLAGAWQPGERGASEALQRFVELALLHYTTDRDQPGIAGTSRLSPHLHFGESSPRQIWNALKLRAARSGHALQTMRQSQFFAELGWREFSHHLLFHFPNSPSEPMRPAFRRFPWREDPLWLRVWQQGKTGYPIVDAGMEELRTTGWMHNRVRMIAASFLVKDLLLSWKEGARWFWDTLVDADLAQNTLGWQWTAGCGADAAPYFRVFNPVTQGMKFDPNGDYVRRWQPALARLPAKWIHQPWLAPPEIRAAAEVQLARDYPVPLVSHGIARQVALECYAQMLA